MLLDCSWFTFRGQHLEGVLEVTSHILCLFDLKDLQFCFFFKKVDSANRLIKIKRTIVFTCLIAMWILVVTTRFGC